MKKINNLKSIKDKKFYRIIMTNFRLPILLILIAGLSIGYMKIYNSSLIRNINSNLKYAMILFLVTGLYFLYSTFSSGIDIIQIVFGQKGKDSLLDSAKRR